MKDFSDFFVRKIQFLIVIFVIAGPLMLFVKKPHHDLLYHLQDRKPIVVTADHFSDLKPNDFVEIETTVDLKNVFVSSAIIGREPSYLFPLEGFPKRFVVHVRDKDFDVSSLEGKPKLQGRIFSSTNLVSPFQHYGGRSGLMLDAYRRVVFEEGSWGPSPEWERWLHQISGDKHQAALSRVTYWVLSVGETPSEENLWRYTDFPVFLVWTIVSVIFLIFFFRKRRLRS